MSIFAQNGGPPYSCEGLCLPEEQEVIRLMLEKVRADSKMDFDKYEEHINWCA